MRKRKRKRNWKRNGTSRLLNLWYRSMILQVARPVCCIQRPVSRQAWTVFSSYNIIFNQARTQRGFEGVRTNPSFLATYHSTRNNPVYMYSRLLAALCSISLLTRIVNHCQNASESPSKSLNFQNFSWGTCPQTPLGGLWANAYSIPVWAIPSCNPLWERLR
jgi:hypothetical protein